MMRDRSAGTGERRGPFVFRGGHPALDLAATLRGRRKAAQTELLATPPDLDAWLAAAGLAPSGGRAAARRATPADLDAARVLREAVYVLAVARARGDALPDAARATLNAVAATPAPAPQLAAAPGAPALAWIDDSPRARLGAIARDAVLLLAGPAGDGVKQCAGDGCATLFVDTSRAGARRWCSMAACGNAAKVADFRRRQGARAE